MKLGRLLFVYRAIKAIGLQQFFKHSIQAKGKLNKISIAGHSIFIRTGSTDLEVALSCLLGEFDILKYLLPKDYNGVIVDAGGYIGTAAIALSNLYPKAKIVCVEPSKDNYEIVKLNVANYKNIKTINAALISSESNSIKLRDRGTGEWGYTVVNKPNDNQDARLLHEVSAVNLSHIVEKFGSVGLLKIDIEGGELDLLINDLVSLEKIPFVFAELHERIVSGCEEKFFDFSRNRILIKGDGEKYLSISRNISQS